MCDCGGSAFRLEERPAGAPCCFRASSTPFTSPASVPTSSNPVPYRAQAQGQLAEAWEWQSAAQQLAACTAAICAAKGAPAGSGSASPRSVSPSKRRSASPSQRTPFGARSRNDENAPSAAPAGAGPAALTVAALAAKADNPRSWLELLQARFGALREAAAAAARTAAEADAAVDAARKESAWHQHKARSLCA